MGTNTLLKWAAGCCCVSMLITLIVVIAVSFATLEPTQIGLDFDSGSQSMNENELYRAGRYFIGPSSHFFVFPTQLKPISFDGTTNAALGCRTQDGLQITISTNFQYRIKDDLQSVLKLFYAFGEVYEEAYVRVARNVFRDTIAEFTAFQMVNARVDVETAMRSAISDALDKYGSIVENFQLLDIVFPSSFSAAISDTQNTLLTVNTAENNKAKVVNDVAAQVAKANIEAQSTYNAALGNAATILATAQAAASAIQIRVATLKNSLGQIAADWTGITNKDLINYQLMSSISNINNQKAVKVNLSPPKIIQCMSDSSVTCPTS